MKVAMIGSGAAGSVLPATEVGRQTCTWLTSMRSI